MKKNLLIFFAVTTFLATLVYADDVDMVCTEKISPLLKYKYTFLKNHENNTYSLLKESSGYNPDTNKKTKTVEFLEKDMNCSVTRDFYLECSHNGRHNGEPFNQFTVSKNKESAKYSLESLSKYIEMRTGRHVSDNKTLSQNLNCSIFLGN